MIAFYCIGLFFWTILAMGFGILLAEKNMKKRFMRRLFLPEYTAGLMAKTLMRDDDNEWKIMLEMGLISYPYGDK